MSACLICSLVCCATVARASETPDALRIRAGWTAPAAGYYLTSAAMRDTVAGWTADRESIRVLRQGMVDLRAEIAAQAEDTKQLVADLRRELAAERAEYNRRIRRGRAQGLLIGLLIGAAGVAIAK